MIKFIKNCGLFATAVLAGIISITLISIVSQVLSLKFFWCGWPLFLELIGFYMAFILGLIFTAYLCASFFRDETRSGRELFLVGAFAVFLVLVLYSSAVSMKGPGYIVPAPFFPFVDDILHGRAFESPLVYSSEHLAQILDFTISRVILMIFAIVPAAIFGKTGVSLYTYLIPSDEKRMAEKEEKSPLFSSLNRLIIFSFCVIIPASAILPFGIGMVYISSGISDIDNSVCGNLLWYPSSVTAVRQNDSTIAVSLTVDFSSMPWAQLYPYESLPLQIIVNGHYLSNQSVIDLQGLKDTINPPEGIITYVNGSSVIITGPDVTINGSRGCDIIVYNNYDKNHPDFYRARV